MKAILQHDERDCGAACLAMIAEHYGYTQSLNFYRDLTHTDQSGASAYEIVQAAASIGFSAEALSGRIEDLQNGLKEGEIKLPFIAHVTTEDHSRHFVVVSAVSKRKMHICDPAKGKIVESPDDFARRWTGNIICFEKNRTFEKQRGSARGVLSFFALLKGQLHRLAGITALSVLISGAGILNAFAFQLIIDHSAEMTAAETAHKHDIEFQTGSKGLNMVLERASDAWKQLSLDGISALFTWLIVLCAIAAVLQYIRGRLIISMSKQLDFCITLPYFNRITEMPVSSIVQRRTGDYLSRYSDIAVIREALSTAVITIVFDTIMAIGCGTLLYFQNADLFRIAAGIVLLYSIVVICNRRRTKESNKQFMEKNACVQSYMKESIDGIESIKVSAVEKQVQNAMKSRLGSCIDAAVRKSRIVMAQDALVTGIETIGITLIVWRGFSMVVQEQMTLGALITFYALLGYLVTPIKNLIEMQPILQSGAVAAERLQDVLDMPIEQTEGLDWESAKPVDCWSVADVSFRYGRQEPLLEKISFSFQRGEKVALVGESGSGKTTFAKLFVRFFEPESGGILADGVDLKAYSIHALREAIAYVSNTSSLFSGTLYENLTLGRQGYSDEWIQRICDITGLSEWIDDARGIRQIVIEEGGDNLSSGQRQRVVIARALLRRPKLLLLDEATSNLDIRTETEILNAIQNEMKDTAILLISHRLASIRNFDKIVFLQNGRIAGAGTHDELRERCKPYDLLMHGDA